jgi:hypothetical protein
MGLGETSVLSCETVFTEIPVIFRRRFVINNLDVICV